jgi:hypothetical protein
VTRTSASEVYVWREPPINPIREAMCVWFRAHGIEPDDVPDSNGHVYRHLLPNLPGITYERYAITRRPGGGTIDRRDADGGIARDTVWVPMEADPLPFPDFAAIDRSIREET